MSSPLDCRGLACPEPVIRCRRFLEEARASGEVEEMFKVLVDNEAARENVSNFLRTQGYAVDARPEPSGGWALIAALDDAPQAAAVAEKLHQPAPVARPRTVVFLPSETVGQGDDELGRKLMLSFLSTLPELGGELWRVILVNGGVRMACEGHPALEKLQALEQSGVTILVCGTCLDFFQLLPGKKVGTTTNMLDIVTAMQLAGKVIRV